MIPVMESSGITPTSTATQLYDRQARVIGEEAQRRLLSTDILIIGLNGVGIEIAKNVVLMGVHSVALFDDNALVHWEDLSDQFFLGEESIGTNRAEACVEKLAALNPFVQIEMLPYSHSTHDLLLHPPEQLIRKFRVVVFAGYCMNLKDLVNFDEECRKQNVAFIVACTHGVFGSLFVDFGPHFEISDPDGEEPHEGAIMSITNDVHGTVSVRDEEHGQQERHGLQDGDCIEIIGVEGMDELRQNPISRVTKIKSPFEFCIGDTSHFKPYVRGGYFTQIKSKLIVDFLSLSESLDRPEFLQYDFSKLDFPAQLHLGMRALAEFSSRFGRTPQCYDTDDAHHLISIANAINETNSPACRVDTINLELFRQMSFTARGRLNPMAAFIGGIAAQEVQKACTGKFSPIHQWFHFEATQILPDELPVARDCQPLGCRYDGQIAVFGRHFQERLTQLHCFLVGAGALGCEYLKNLALMGVGCSQQGRVTVTDMDSIELSNLSRQFLFRKSHIGAMKSQVACEAARQMNPALNTRALTDRISDETEHIFSDLFWSEMDIVLNALDNVHTRLYVDSRCVYYRKPLIESGTLGAKGNIQVVIPFQTESYGSSRDPPERSYPQCTIHFYPSVIQHTIMWAKELFSSYFAFVPSQVNKYLESPSDYLRSESADLQVIQEALVTDKCVSFEDCVQWARYKFEQLFNHQIHDLLLLHPLEELTSTGMPFWSGAKRPPSPLVFDSNQSEHLDFIIAASTLRATVFGIPGVNCENRDYFRTSVENVKPPEYVPALSSSVNSPPDLTSSSSSSSVGSLSSARDALPSSEEQLEIAKATRESTTRIQLTDLVCPPGLHLLSIEFEKDNDNHIDFITSASNLRAHVYKIPGADRNKTKGIAGRIIPAMVTTTALVTGLDCLELYKVVQAKRVEHFRNSFVNLALPFITQSEVNRPSSVRFGDVEWSLWDRIEADFGRDVTLQDLIDWLLAEHNLTVLLISCGKTALFGVFFPGRQQQERLSMPVAKLVRMLMRCNFPPNQQFLMLNATCQDPDGNDVDGVPPIRYRFRHDGPINSASKRKISQSCAGTSKKGKRKVIIRKKLHHNDTIDDDSEK